jgi:hypothetical protein
VFPVTAREAVAAMGGCDFAVMPDPSDPEPPFFEYPFNKSMRAIGDKLKAAAEESMLPVKRIHAYSQTLTLYQRFRVRVEGDSGGWVTSKGIDLVVAGSALRAWPTVEVRGRTILHELLKGNLKGQARYRNRDGKLKKLDVAVDPLRAQYDFKFHVNPDDMPGDQDVRIHLQFDRYFVPKQARINEDTRELVIMTPTSIVLRP